MAIDYGQIRGLNYVGSWAPNPVGHWRFYDAARVEAELGYMAAIGVNAVRVFLSYAVWAVEGAAMEAKVADLCQRSAARGIAVLLILWDTIGDPPSRTPYDDLSGWVSNPGPAKVADPAFLPEADAYVAAMLGAAIPTGAELIWDVMNEPDNEPLGWLAHHQTLVKDLAPTAVTPMLRVTPKRRSPASKRKARAASRSLPAMSCASSSVQSSSSAANSSPPRRASTR